MKWAKDPLVSIFMDGCAEKRKKMYPRALPNTTTMALRQLRFPMWWIVCSISKNWYSKDKKYSLAEMNKARVENFDSAPEMFIEVTSLKKSPTGMILLKWKRWSTVSHPLLLL